MVEAVLHLARLVMFQNVLHTRGAAHIDGKVDDSLTQHPHPHREVKKNERMRRKSEPKVKLSIADGKTSVSNCCSV